MATPTIQPADLAAPLDLLLTSATRPFARRMMPNATWVRFGANLAKQPGAVAGRAGTLARELGSVVVGRSHRAPARADKRFTDPAWQDNPFLHRIMQAYLAAAEAADGLLADADLEWRDNDKMRFVVYNENSTSRHSICSLSHNVHIDRRSIAQKALDRSKIEILAPTAHG